MEIKWDDRGKIPYEIYRNNTKNIGYIETWKQLELNKKSWWNEVYDACLKAEKVVIPGGNEILIVKEN